MQAVMCVLDKGWKEVGFILENEVALLWLSNKWKIFNVLFAIPSFPDRYWKTQILLGFSFFDCLSCDNLTTWRFISVHKMSVDLSLCFSKNLWNSSVNTNSFEKIVYDVYKIYKNLNNFRIYLEYLFILCNMLCVLVRCRILTWWWWDKVEKIFVMTTFFVFLRRRLQFGIKDKTGCKERVLVSYGKNGGNKLPYQIRRPQSGFSILLRSLMPVGFEISKSFLC